MLTSSRSRIAAAYYQCKYAYYIVLHHWVDYLVLAIASSTNSGVHHFIPVSYYSIMDRVRSSNEKMQKR